MGGFVVEKGPVQTLCDEIGFRFEPRMETTTLFVSFVRSLVAEIRDMRDLQDKLSHLSKKSPSFESAEVLSRVSKMLDLTFPDMRDEAAHIHSYIHEVHPDDTYPCDHLIDMASSCVSAIRFGLEAPCRSRHAAEAASHIWKRAYGISRFDSQTQIWQREWARNKLQSAILDLIPA